MFILRIFRVALLTLMMMRPAGLGDGTGTAPPIPGPIAQSASASPAPFATKYLHKELLFNSFMPDSRRNSLAAVAQLLSANLKIIAHFLPTLAVSSIAATLASVVVDLLPSESSCRRKCAGFYQRKSVAAARCGVRKSESRNPQHPSRKKILGINKGGNNKNKNKQHYHIERERAKSSCPRCHGGLIFFCSE